MIAIVNYKMGNLRSVQNALTRLGADFTVTDNAETIRHASHVLLPGVGSAGEAMRNLHEVALPPVIRSLRQPVLGICVGMQVLCRHSEEGDAECLGVFDAKVRRFSAEVTEKTAGISGIAAGVAAVPDGVLESAAGERLKVPHMGWNQLGNMESKLFAGIESGSYVYFVHSYFAGLCPDTIGTAHYGTLFSAALKYENFYGVQFHPEKSGETGLRLLQNFLSL